MKGNDSVKRRWELESAAQGEAGSWTDKSSNTRGQSARSNEPELRCRMDSTVMKLLPLGPRVTKKRCNYVERERSIFCRSAVNLATS